MTLQEPTIRDGVPADIEPITTLLFEHGANDWNHLPPKVREDIAAIASGATRAVVAEANGQIVGAITYDTHHQFSKYQTAGREGAEQGYIAEAVVREDYRGRALGSKLFLTAFDRLAAQGIREIYAKRHADNVASGRTMERSGMSVVDEFDDPEIRLTGSKRTTITRIITT